MSPHERLYKDGLDRKEEKKKQQVGARARVQVRYEMANYWLVCECASLTSGGSHCS